MCLEKNIETGYENFPKNASRGSCEKVYFRRWALYFSEVHAPLLFRVFSAYPIDVAILRFHYGFEQKSIGEFLTSKNHAQDLFHKRLYNPLTAEFGVRTRRDLDYMITEGLPNMKLVSWALRCFRFVSCMPLRSSPSPASLVYISTCHVLFGSLSALSNTNSVRLKKILHVPLRAACANTT